MIVMDAPPGQEDIRPWLDVAARLSAAGLQVPQLHDADSERGFVLMSDLGNALMLPTLNDASVDALYGSALAALLTLPTRVRAGGRHAYAAARRVAGMELMQKRFLTAPL